MVQQCDALFVVPHGTAWYSVVQRGTVVWLPLWVGATKLHDHDHFLFLDHTFCSLVLLVQMQYILQDSNTNGLKIVGVFISL